MQLVLIYSLSMFVQRYLQRFVFNSIQFGKQKNITYKMKITKSNYIFSNEIVFHIEENYIFLDL